MALGLSPSEIVEKGGYSLLTKADHWERVSLSDVAEVKNGNAFKSSFFSLDSGIPLIRIRDISKLKTEHRYTGEYDSQYLVETGDILIGMDGDFTASRWHGSRALLNQRVCKITLRSDLFNERFLFLCLQPYLDAINAETSSVTVKHLSSKTVEVIPLPLPPLHEQRRLVSKIEELFSELNKGIESLEKVREQLKVYRQAVLKHAFEGKLTAQWREENKDKLEEPEKLLARIKCEREARYEQQLKEWKILVRKWKDDGKQGKKPKSPLKPKVLEPLSHTSLANLPALPLGWLWVRLGSIGLVGTGVTPLKSNLTYYSGGDVPWVTSGMLNESYVRHCSNYVTDKALNDTNLRLYPPHTLVVALYGEGKTRGKCSELLIHAATNQAVAAIVQEGSASSLRGFLKWFLTKNYGVMRLKSSGGVQPNLNLGIIENTAVPLCSMTETKEIERRIERQLSTLDYIETVINSEIQKSAILRQSILKQAFSGQLVAQEKNDESASMLLARIRAAKNREKIRAQA